MEFEINFTPRTEQPHMRQHFTLASAEAETARVLAADSNASGAIIYQGDDPVKTLRKQ